MAKIRITIDTDNDAFQAQGDGGGHEVARILRELASRYATFGLLTDVRLQDINGNAVGWALVGGRR